MGETPQILFIHRTQIANSLPVSFFSPHSFHSYQGRKLDCWQTTTVIPAEWSSIAFSRDICSLLSPCMVSAMALRCQRYRAVNHPWSGLKCSHQDFYIYMGGRTVHGLTPCAVSLFCAVSLANRPIDSLVPRPTTVDADLSSVVVSFPDDFSHAAECKVWPARLV